MQVENPMLSKHKDVAHREASACGDAHEVADPFQDAANKGARVVPALEADMNSVVSDHNRSSKAQVCLRSNQLKGESLVIKLSHGCITRNWLTRYQMGDGVHESIPALHDEYFESCNDSKVALLLSTTFVAGTAWFADFTAELCPCRVCWHSPVATSQILTVQSPAPKTGPLADTTFVPSGENSAHFTLP